MPTSLMRGQSETVLDPVMAVDVALRGERRVVSNLRRVDENVGVAVPLLLINHLTMLVPHPSQDDLYHRHSVWPTSATIVVFERIVPCRLLEAEAAEEGHRRP